MDYDGMGDWGRFRQLERKNNGFYIVRLSSAYRWSFYTFCLAFSCPCSNQFQSWSSTNLREEVAEAGFPDYMYDIMRIVKPIFAFFLIMGICVESDYITMYGIYNNFYDWCSFYAHKSTRQFN